jgi:hypothetical protein
VLAAYSVVSAILALLIVDQGFGYQTGHVAGLAALAALLVFSAGARSRHRSQQEGFS